jgi:hypothetical protein
MKKHLVLLLAMLLFSACGGGSKSGSGDSVETHVTPDGQVITSNPDAPAVTNGASVSIDSVAIDSPAIATGAKITFAITANTEYQGNFVLVTLDNVGSPDNTRNETAQFVFNSVMSESMPALFTNYFGHYEYGGAIRNLDPATFTYVKKPLSYTGSIDISRDASGLAETSYSYTKGLMGVSIIPSTHRFTGKTSDGTATVDITQPLELRVHVCIYENAADPVTINGVETKTLQCTTTALQVTLP